eukprot:TRINITY_DN3491_c0_g1_i1.p1 TRINITY_DN3491_c0_g1~~TRINITY_DN3491_c0_g1_i1.p1  ORF type:complete len:527 (-),score=173.48 TRINITY_DN3491_c0_g1_i1:317-1849(-)
MAVRKSDQYYASFYTRVEEIPRQVARVRASFEQGVTRPLEWRRAQLRRLKEMMLEERENMMDALRADLSQTEFMASLGETDGVVDDIELAMRSLEEWTAVEEPERLPAVHQPGSGKIYKDPYGVVLIIAPWNYPMRLCLMPLVGAIAAGNCVVVKPSEVASASGRFLGETLPKYLDGRCFYVVEGGVPVSQALLKARFDYIFYTGNTAVGRVVMKAAAEHLTPVTLELGGKSPVLVDSDADLDATARRIVWGKFTNSGQTCVAPDYVLVHESIKATLVRKMKQCIVDFYSDDPKNSADYTRVINERHTRRLQGLLDEQRQNVVHGGEVSINDRYISPTLILEPSMTSRLMSEEIFGPLLPVIGVKGMDDAIRIVKSKEKPLALYVFTQDEKVADKIACTTSSGNICVNDILVQIAIQHLPFGGVGHSGMGQYNGKHTFDTFVHRKTVVSKSTWPHFLADPAIRYPPYTPSKIWWFSVLSKPLPAATLPIVCGVALASLMYLTRKKWMARL